MYNLGSTMTSKGSQIQTSQTGCQSYSDTSPCGECSLAIFTPGTVEKTKMKKQRGQKRPKYEFYLEFVGLMRALNIIPEKKV